MSSSTTTKVLQVSPIFLNTFELYMCKGSPTTLTHASLVCSPFQQHSTYGVDLSKCKVVPLNLCTPLDNTPSLYESHLQRRTIEGHPLARLSLLPFLETNHDVHNSLMQANQELGLENLPMSLLDS